MHQYWDMVQCHLAFQFRSSQIRYQSNFLERAPFLRPHAKVKSSLDNPPIVVVLPSCIIFTCAAILHHIVYKQIQKVRFLKGTTAASVMESLASHKRAIKTIFCMVAGFYFCWSPFMVLLIWNHFYGYIYSSTAGAIVAWIAISNSSWNPLVYLPTMKEYQKIYKKIFVSKICSSDR